MKFTPEEIANYREIINNVKEIEALAKHDASSGIYYGAVREAALARLELKRIAYAVFPDALAEIERLREALQNCRLWRVVPDMIATTVDRALKGGGDE